MEQARKQQFQELPTIMDEYNRLQARINGSPLKNQPKVQTEDNAGGLAEVVTVEEEERRQSGLLCELNDIEKMLELGNMALFRYEEYQKVFALPSFMEYENIQKEHRRQESAMSANRGLKFDHLIL